MPHLASQIVCSPSEFCDQWVAESEARIQEIEADARNKQLKEDAEEEVVDVKPKFGIVPKKMELQSSVSNVRATRCPSHP